MDDFSNFKYIWEKWICPLINDLYYQTDKEFREFCGLEIRNLEKICNKAEKYYQSKRREVKKIFY